MHILLWLDSITGKLIFETCASVLELQDFAALVQNQTYKIVIMLLGSLVQRTQLCYIG